MALTPSVTITVTDSGTGNLIDSESITVTVNDTNTAPVLDPIGDQSVTTNGATLSFTATATDSDLPADTLTYSLDGASVGLGMSIDPNTGVLLDADRSPGWLDPVGDDYRDRFRHGKPDRQ